MLKNLQRAPAMAVKISGPQREMRIVWKTSVISAIWTNNCENRTFDP